MQPCTNAPHVHREHLHYILRNHRAAVAYLLKHGEIYIHSAARPPTGILQVFGISEQDSGGQLIVQEAAFDESCFGDVETRFDSNIIAHIHTKSARFRRRVRLGVQQQLQRIEGALCFGIFSVHMHRGVFKLKCSLQHLPRARIYMHGLRFRVVCLQAAYWGHA